jgi:hypothetical protein
MCVLEAGYAAGSKFDRGKRFNVQRTNCRAEAAPTAPHRDVSDPASRPSPG